MKARITAEYATCCFCPKPDLPDGPVIATRPRFEFAKAARSFAEANGLKNIEFNTRTTDRSAMAYILAPCAHRQIQSVRLTWRGHYDPKVG